MPPTGSGGPIERFLIRSMDLNDQQDVQDNGHAGTPIDDQDGGVEGVDGRGDGHEGDDEAKRKRHHTSSSSDGETDRFSESMLGNTSMAPLSPSSGPSPQRRPRLLAVATPGGGGEHDIDDILTQEPESEDESVNENPANLSTAHPPTNLSTPTPTPTPQMQPSNPIPPSLPI